MEEPGYRKLLVWQKAHKNALLIIRLLEKCNPKYGRIFNQCISSATSIGANIAEGNAQATSKQKKNYFAIALNSAYEFDNWIQILKDSKLVYSDINDLLVCEKENIEVIKISSKIISNLKS